LKPIEQSYKRKGSEAVYFEKAGYENTDATLKIAREEATRRNIRYILVASTTGNTGLKAVKMFKETILNTIVVTHNTGFKQPGIQELDIKTREEIEKLGGKILTATMVLRGLGTAIRGKMHYSQEQIVADTLRMMGQGTKVCVEMAAMAADAGLIPCEDIVSVAGTGRGADTALIIEANSSNRFFDIKIKEVLVKPKSF
jgi:hypothetical protein